MNETATGDRSPHALGSWAEEGWCVVEGVVGAAELAAARRALEHLFPSAAALAADPDHPDHRRWTDSWDAPWPEFPFVSATLNGIVLSDALLDLAGSLLGTDDLRLYLALATAKYAGQPSGYNRLLHADYPNHTLTVPRRDPGYQQVETFVYLCDVGPENGATRFVSRRLTDAVPVEEHTLNYVDHAAAYAAAVDASAPAGSVVAYRPDVYHCSVEFTDPAQVRFMLHASFRPAAMEWGGYQAWPFKGFSPAWHRFVGGATPRQLVALGFPAPGHPYWTAETLAGVGARYPDLDLGPWRHPADQEG